MPVSAIVHCSAATAQSDAVVAHMQGTAVTLQLYNTVSNRKSAEEVGRQQAGGQVGGWGEGGGGKEGGGRGVGRRNARGGSKGDK